MRRSVSSCVLPAATVIAVACLWLACGGRSALEGLGSSGAAGAVEQAGGSQATLSTGGAGGTAGTGGVSATGGQLIHICGDGVLDPGEQCDDGNTLAGDGCNGLCRIEPPVSVCGDGVLDPGEECDDQNSASHDGCSSGCTLEAPTWVQLNTPAVPDASGEGTMAYDPLRDRMLLKVGEATWALQDEDWVQLDGRVNYAHPRITYDIARDRFVFLSALGGSGAEPGSTWEWVDEQWQVWEPPTSPPRRWAYGLTYDRARARVVLFGGVSSRDYDDRTWEYDGIDWREVPVSNRPPPRAYLGMTFNARSNYAVIFGGGRYLNNNTYEFRNDTWTYDGTTWADVAPGASPSERQYVGLAYDEWRDRVVLFGGTFLGGLPFDDTWEFDGTSWVETTPTTSPDGRVSTALAYDSRRRRVVLFGDCETCGNGPETWTYRWESSWPDEDCQNGVDDDSDTVTDCADPDCEGQPCAGGY